MNLTSFISVSCLKLPTKEENGVQVHFYVVGFNASPNVV